MVTQDSDQVIAPAITEDQLVFGRPSRTRTAWFAFCTPRPARCESPLARAFSEMQALSMPVGNNAAVQAVSFSLQQFISPDGTIVTAP